jgi:hypothetical protein
MLDKHLVEDLSAQTQSPWFAPPEYFWERNIAGIFVDDFSTFHHMA